MTNKLNGSVDLLAKAMRQVFSEAVGEAVKPLEDKIDGVEERLGTKVCEEVGKVRKGVARGMDKARKDINRDVTAIMEGKR